MKDAAKQGQRAQESRGRKKKMTHEDSGELEQSAAVGALKDGRILTGGEKDRKSTPGGRDEKQGGRKAGGSLQSATDLWRNRDRDYKKQSWLGEHILPQISNNNLQRGGN